MQTATSGTVLGAFTGASIGDGAGRARLFRENNELRVETAGRDGKQAVFDIAYTFGVFPLQQYLIRFPDGRLQVLDWAWDARPRTEGGQRWFRPLEAASPGSALHWTGREMNWNFACAACHSTGVRANYDEAADRFATTWTEMNVACAACHGPGAGHLAWAERRDPADTSFGFRSKLGRQDVPRFGFAKPTQAIASLVAAGSREKLGDVCFPCHARREQIVAAPQIGDHFLDDYRPALLDPALYEPDGQNKSEVFEFGAFSQSRMARAGVTCANCHDAHSLSLKAPGNAVCTQCHRPAVFDAASHTHHPAGSAASQCVACHMPSRTFMGVHVRHDHGFRLPRPGLADIGVSNGCAACHADRSARWLADALARWNQAPRPTGFADAFAAVQAGAPADRRLIRALGDAGLPGIVRGTAAGLLGDPAAPDAAAALTAAAQDADPLVRLGAARALAQADDATRAAAGTPLLSDPSRAVRLEAAQSLADLPRDLLPPAASDRLRSSVAELRSALETGLDRPETRTDYGSLLARLGLASAADAQFRAAMRLAPDFMAARVDLADVDRARGNEAGARAVLHGATAITPADLRVVESMALSDIRNGDRSGAIVLLTQLCARAPQDAAAARLLALALSEANRTLEAETILRRALAARPHDVSLLDLLARAEPGGIAMATRMHLGEEDAQPSR